MRLLISCGEASGDLYAAELLRETKLRRGDLEAFGLGGDRLLSEGASAVAHIRDLAVVGLVEVIRHLPRIRGVFQDLLREVDRRRPDAAVLIDYPDFNLRLAAALKSRGIPVVYYVSPQIWAWRRGRMKQIQRTVSRMLVIFPFEEALYREAGVPVSFVGHPLVDLIPETDGTRTPPDEWGLDPHKRLVALLPGSRRREVAWNLPPLLGAVDLLSARHGDLEFALGLAPSLEAAPVLELIGGRKIRVLHGETPRLLRSSTLALVASGTATVEAALTNTPEIVVYRLSPLTYALGRPFVSVPHYAMVNLIVGRRLVPELIQGRFTAEAVAAEASELLLSPERLSDMGRGLREVRRVLGGGGASKRAAEALLECLG